MDMAMAKFVVAQDILPSSALTYAKSLSATARRFDQPVPLLRLVMSGLAARGAGIPTKQAPPISREELDSLIPRLPREYRVPTLLAWKAAARWADMLALTKASFLQLRPQEVIIRWGTTKSTRLTPFAPTLWTVVEDPDPQRLMPLIHHVNQLPRPDSPFTTLTSHDFCRMASRLKVKWTAHSMKRGAVTHLIEQAAEGRVDPWIVARLAKHKAGLMEFPETTLRYAANDPATARMLGTQDATRLL
jgi:hypothetical protein